jgi:23S rRNA (pseudouridine1915-N3)-methyltransferase
VPGADWFVLAIGRAGRSPEAELFQRYAARLRPRLGLQEFAEAKGSADEMRRREAMVLLGAMPAQALVVALDLGGDAPDSAGLASLLGRWAGAGKPVRFVIGGAEGLDAAVLARADATLSLGRLTWPHLLARALLAEALFRAQSISTGHPYHRAYRPRTLRDAARNG